MAAYQLPHPYVKDLLSKISIIPQSRASEILSDLKIWTIEYKTLSDMHTHFRLLNVPISGKKGDVYNMYVGSIAFNEEMVIKMLKENPYFFLRDDYRFPLDWTVSEFLESIEETGLGEQPNFDEDNYEGIIKKEETSEEVSDSIVPTIIIKDEEISEKDEETEDPLSSPWVMCDRCSKWRKLGSSIDSNSLPEKWYCEMNVWDPRFNNCEAEEEATDDVKEEGEEENNEQEEEDYEEIIPAKEKRRLLWEFKKHVVAYHEKKQTRLQKRENQKNDTLTNATRRATVEADDIIANMTSEEKEEASRLAKKRDRKGRLPIHCYPEQFSDETATKHLLRDIRLGVDLGATDNLGRVAFHYAFITDCPMYRQALLDAGADPIICDDSDRIPEEYCFEGSFKRRNKSMWDKFI